MIRPPSTFAGGLLLYALCAGAALLMWPYIKARFDDNAGARQYDEYGYTGDPGRFDRWRNSKKGGYSDFYPGPRTLRQEGRQ